MTDPHDATIDDAKTTMILNLTVQQRDALLLKWHAYCDEKKVAMKFGKWFVKTAQVAIVDRSGVIEIN